MSRQSAALSSATQHAMPPESDRKRGTESLNTRFPLPTLLCAGYSVKLIKKKYINKNNFTLTQKQNNTSNARNSIFSKHFSTTLFYLHFTYKYKVIQTNANLNNFTKSRKLPEIFGMSMNGSGQCLSRTISDVSTHCTSGYRLQAPGFRRVDMC